MPKEPKQEEIARWNAWQEKVQARAYSQSDAEYAAELEAWSRTRRDRMARTGTSIRLPQIEIVHTNDRTTFDLAELTTNIDPVPAIDIRNGYPLGQLAAISNMDLYRVTVEDTQAEILKLRTELKFAYDALAKSEQENLKLREQRDAFLTHPIFKRALPKH